MQTKKILFISLSAALIIYFLVSLILLDGKFIYVTSFNKGTIQESKVAKLFVSNDLKIDTAGDSLIKWNENFDIWTNKRYEVKYYGVLFHWTYTEPEWRYLNFEFKNNLNPLGKELCIIQKDGSLYGCCDRISCSVGETVQLNFCKCNDSKIRLGTVKITVK